MNPHQKHFSAIKMTFFFLTSHSSVVYLKGSVNTKQYTMHISKKQTNKTIIQTFKDVFSCKNGKNHFNLKHTHN